MPEESTLDNNLGKVLTATLAFVENCKIESRKVARAKEILNFKPVRSDLTTFNIKLAGEPA